MTKTKWLRLDSVQSIHDLQLVAHGGREGVRDVGLLESALARPAHQAAYGTPDLFDLAAAYTFGIVNNHPFIDGNKRTGFLATYTFLSINGWRLNAPEADAYVAVISLTQKEMTESAFAAWLRDNSKKKTKKS